MTRAAAALIVAVLLTLPRAASAGPVEGAALAQASAKASVGDCPGALGIVNALASSRLLLVERAEAHRIAGLCKLATGDRAGAWGSFLAYLRLVPDGHFDPALVSPEAVALLEQVRAAHAAELRAARPRVRTRRSAFLNLLPPVGQFQNGQVVKGILLGSAELVLLGTNIGTYVALKRRCHDDGTCDSTSDARSLRALNITSGVLFAGVAVYGIIDGYVVQHRLEREAEDAVSVAVWPGGAALSVTF